MNLPKRQWTCPRQAAIFCSGPNSSSTGINLQALDSRLRQMAIHTVRARCRQAHALLFLIAGMERARKEHGIKHVRSNSALWSARANSWGWGVEDTHVSHAILCTLPWWHPSCHMQTVQYQDWPDYDNKNVAFGAS